MELRRQAMLLDMEIHMVNMKCNFSMVHDKVLHPGQIMLLLTMQALGPSSQRRLARQLYCSPASIGVSVKRLERAGLIDKQTDEQDLRTTRVALTEKGKQIAEMSEKVVEEMAQRKFAGFSDIDMENFNDYLRRIKGNLEEYQDELNGQKGANSLSMKGPGESDS